MSLGRIALTGAAGKLGTFLRAQLVSDCDELVLIDQVPVAQPGPRERVITCRLTEDDRMSEALQGCHAVLHFAGYPREAAWDLLLPANIESVIHLWEGARLAGVERIIYASSNHAIGLYPRSTTLAEKVHPMPDSRYGLSKVFMEGLAQLYATKHGLRGFGLRIGHCSLEPVDARMLSTWVHPEDLAALVRVGLTAEYEHELVYGVSDNGGRWWPNERARELGYYPTHSADSFAPSLSSRRSGDPVQEHFQGGSYAAEGFSNARFTPR